MLEYLIPIQAIVVVVFLFYLSIGTLKERYGIDVDILKKASPKILKSQLNYVQVMKRQKRTYEMLKNELAKELNPEKYKNMNNSELAEYILNNRIDLFPDGVRNADYQKLKDMGLSKKGKTIAKKKIGQYLEMADVIDFVRKEDYYVDSMTLDKINRIVRRPANMGRVKNMLDKGIIQPEFKKSDSTDFSGLDNLDPYQDRDNFDQKSKGMLVEKSVADYVKVFLQQYNPGWNIEFADTYDKMKDLFENEDYAVYQRDSRIYLRNRKDNTKCTEIDLPVIMEKDGEKHIINLEIKSGEGYKAKLGDIDKIKKRKVNIIKEATGNEYVHLVMYVPEDLIKEEEKNVLDEVGGDLLSNGYTVENIDTLVKEFNNKTILKKLMKGYRTYPV